MRNGKGRKASMRGRTGRRQPPLQHHLQGSKKTECKDRNRELGVGGRKKVPPTPDAAAHGGKHKKQQDG